MVPVTGTEPYAALIRANGSLTRWIGAALTIYGSRPLLAKRRREIISAIGFDEPKMDIRHKK
jgi:hypothetical protein